MTLREVAGEVEADRLACNQHVSLEGGFDVAEGQACAFLHGEPAALANYCEAEGRTYK